MPWKWQNAIRGNGQPGVKDENEKLSIERYKEKTGYCYFDLPFRFPFDITENVCFHFSLPIYVTSGKVVQNCRLLPLASLELKKPALIEYQHWQNVALRRFIYINERNKFMPPSLGNEEAVERKYPNKLSKVINK